MPLPPPPPLCVCIKSFLFSHEKWKRFFCYFLVFFTFTCIIILPIRLRIPAVGRRKFKCNVPRLACEWQRRCNPIDEIAWTICHRSKATEIASHSSQIDQRGRSKKQFPLELSESDDKFVEQWLFEFLASSCFRTNCWHSLLRAPKGPKRPKTSKNSFGRLTAAFIHTSTYNSFPVFLQITRQNKNDTKILQKQWPVERDAFYLENSHLAVSLTLGVCLFSTFFLSYYIADRCQRRWQQRRSEKKRNFIYSSKMPTSQHINAK